MKEEGLWESLMVLRLMFLGMALIAGCGDSVCKRRMEIIPGLTMEYYTPWHSRIVSGKYGVIAEGKLFLAICEHGIAITGDGGSVYVDLLGNVLDERDETLRRAESGDTYGTYDAISAIGMSTEISRREFVRQMKALKDRVRERQRQDGVRPL